MSVALTPFAFATACTFSVGLAVMSITSIASAPTAILSMYTAAPGKNIEPRSATPITAIAAARPETSVDLLMGIGGTPEGVISAAALKCVGGGIQGRLWPRSEEERRQLVDAGYDLDKVLLTDDLVAGDDVFVAATGVTTGALLRGVRYVRDGAITDSIVMRSRSGTVRRIEARHNLEKLTYFTGREFR